MKIHTIKMYQEFDAPVEQVWEDFNDHVKLGSILGQKIERIVDSSDPTNINGLGSVRLLKVPMMPFEETIRKSEKPTRIEYQITKGTPLDHHYGTMLFKSLPNGKSALDYTIEIGTKIPLLGSIVSAGLKKAIGDGLKKYAGRLRK